MLTVRKSADRGRTRLGWLDSFHTFSFGDYQDAAHERFRTLRVLNDDRVAAGQGFGTHPHRDMEIITTVISGELAHRDSLGNGSTIRAGEWQVMSAGTGVRHSEMNPSPDEAAHFLQMWVMPRSRGLAPAYGQVAVAPVPGTWQTVAAPDGAPLTLRQDASLSVAHFRTGDRARYELAPGRGAWLHLATGRARVNGVELTAGDGVAIEGEAAIELVGMEVGQGVLFDLA